LNLLRGNYRAQI